MADDLLKSDIFFEVDTPQGFSVRVTREYWELIVTIKHPVMAGREFEVQETLKQALIVVSATGQALQQFSIECAGNQDEERIRNKRK